MSMVRFNVNNFENSRRNFSKIKVYCCRIKEEMEILDIKYFPEGVFHGLTEDESTMVVAASKNGLFCPKVYTGNGQLFYEFGEAWLPEWRNTDNNVSYPEDEDIECPEDSETIIKWFTNWNERINDNDDHYSPFNLVVSSEETAGDPYSLKDTWIHDGVSSEVGISDDAYISAKKLYDYICSKISKTYEDFTGDDSELILDKMREAYYNVLNFFKDYKNYVSISERQLNNDSEDNKSKETPKHISNHYKIEDINDDKRYAKAKVCVSIEGNESDKEVLTDVKIAEPRPMIADDGKLYNGVNPDDKTVVGRLLGELDS